MQNIKQFGVVFVQMHVSDNKQVNIQHAERLIRAAVVKYQPKLIVLPEYFNTKWGKQYFEQFAETFPTGETFAALAHLAKELHIYLVGGSMPELETTTKSLYNTTVVFSPLGQLVAKYRKIHLIEMDVSVDQLPLHYYSSQNDQLQRQHIKLHEAEYFQAGKELAFFELDGVKIGLGIGYDMSFQELALLYRKQGVEMIIYPSVYPASFGYMHWEQLNRVRAIDNQMYVLGVAQARSDAWPSSQHADLADEQFVQFGRSMLVDYRGRVVARAGDDEEFVYALLKFDELEAYREHFTLFKHKRADIYDTVYKY